MHFRVSRDVACKQRYQPASESRYRVLKCGDARAELNRFGTYYCVQYSHWRIVLLSVKPAVLFPTIILFAAMVACGGGGSSATPSISPSSNSTPPGGVIWQKVNVPSAATQLTNVAFNSSGHWFIADRNHGFYRSTDQGASWTQINT